LDVELKLERVFAGFLLPLDRYSLKYIKSSISNYPELAKLVPNYFLIPASLILIERFFSVAGKKFPHKLCCFKILMYIKCYQ